MTKEEFNDSLTDNRLAIAKFSASWCGPCRMLKPVFEELEKEYSDIRFIEVDIDESGDIAAEYGIMNIPTIMFFNNFGSLIDMSVGMQSKESLKEKIEHLRIC